MNGKMKERRDDKNMIRVLTTFTGYVLPRQNAESEYSHESKVEMVISTNSAETW